MRFGVMSFVGIAFIAFVVVIIILYLWGAAIAARPA
jgi:hypothetical protein